MGHTSWHELEQRQLAASAQISIGSLWPEENLPDAHEIIGHCIIEATEEVGVLHRPIGYQSPSFASPLSASPEAYKVAHNLDELSLQCRLASLKVPTGSVWEHAKTHGTYKVLGRCVLEVQNIDALPTPKISVLYHAIARPRVTFARPLSSWLGLVDVAGKPALRFQELV